jgi:iron complex outermembrane recepter protein
MKFTQRPIAHAISVLLLGAALPVFAQTAPAPAPAAVPTAEAEKKKDEKRVERVDQVEITGIRASLQKSIDAKRDAETNVEVVSAEDVGKMPDKNIADALSRVAGVNVQFGGALAMDEAERVAIRGTSPNLNLVTVSGHALSSGDWHVGDQGSSGRSIGFGLMPSQLIGRATVYKTGQADITEGGISGSVDIELRRPLTSFTKSLTGEVSLGAVYATLPKKTDPQLSGLLAWKNDANTFGVMIQAFLENRHMRRDGQETFGFNTISAATATAQGNPALANVRLPGSLNSALFEGVRERQGAYLGVQFKPTAGIDLNLSAFHSTLNANNYNSSAFALPNQLLNNGWKITNPVIEGDVLVGATLSRPDTAPATQRVVGLQFDHNVREGAKSISSFYDLDGSFKVNDRLSFKARIGYTEGSGVTNSQPTATFAVLNPNITYRINTSRPTDYSITDATGKPISLSNLANVSLISNVGAGVESSDKENYLHLDGEYKLGWGGISAVKFGGRTSKHDRRYDVIGPRWNAQDNGDTILPTPFTPVTGGLLVPFATPPTPATTYPGNYASGIDANFPRDLFRFNADQLRAFAAANVNWDPVRNKIYTSGYTVKETNNAAYLMADFEYDRLTGNVGARAVGTEVTSLAYQAIPSGTAAGQCAPLVPCAVPGAIVGSRFASYLPQTVTTKHTTVLPSLNLRYALTNDMIARFSLSKTLGRPNYNELAAAVSLNNTLLTGTSGNPNLKPITANNVDATFAWYFNKRGYVSGGVFYQELKDYVKAGTSQVEFFNTATNTNSLYTVTSRIGIDAKVKGAEVAAEVPIGAGFGVGANLTYVDAKDAAGVELLGTSKTTYNLVGFYEDDRYSARLAWNHRSDYAIGFVGNGTRAPGNGVHKYKGYGGLALSLGYKINDRYSVTFDANNITDPVRSTYFITENAPGYWHQSGRQFFVNFRAKI